MARRNKTSEESVRMDFFSLRYSWTDSFFLLFSSSGVAGTMTGLTTSADDDESMGVAF